MNVKQPLTKLVKFKENSATMQKINAIKEKLEMDSENDESNRKNLQYINSYNRKLETKLRELKVMQEKVNQRAR